MFGSKARRIAELEAQIAQRETELEIVDETWQRKLATKDHVTVALRNQVEYLVRTIRQMDDQIFSMSQRTDWIQMRPHFQTLMDAMTARKVAESNRIADVLRSELINTYRPNDAQKKITST